MKAIIQDRYGSPDVLALGSVDKPIPAESEALGGFTRPRSTRATGM